MIREYSLPKYRQINIEKHKVDVDISQMSFLDAWIYLTEKKIWDNFNKNFIDEVNKKHPSTYRNGIKKLNK